MAEVKDNILLKGLSGAFGKDEVYKTINGKTFKTKYPDRSRVIYTKEQLECRGIFGKASQYASSIVKDPAKKAAYPVKGSDSVYHTALKDYIAEHAAKAGNKDAPPLNP